MRFGGEKSAIWGDFWLWRMKKQQPWEIPVAAVENMKEKSIVRNGAKDNYN